MNLNEIITTTIKQIEKSNVKYEITDSLTEQVKQLQIIRMSALQLLQYLSYQKEETK